MNDIDWNQARAFCATADAGSLSAAARKLGSSQPTLSRQVATLEAALGVALFERLGKKLVLTPTGLGLLDHARAMAAAADAMALAAAGRSQDISGRVCISATDAFSAYILPDLVARIRRAAPQITIAIVATDSISDLRRREADIAIRHVRPTEPELIGKSIGEMEACLYASDGWIAANGMPLSVADLARADMLAFEPADRFIDYLGGTGIKISTEQCRIVSANALTLWEMLRKGLGVGVMLRWAAERQPGLARVLPDLPPIPVPVWLVTHRELRTSRRVRIVFEIIADALRRLTQRAAH
ncbi:MAG: LysR family transcriptional regulator [Beijerinckiaceae bacterium]